MNSVIKDLLIAAKDLQKKENLDQVIHCLQILSVTDDLSVFDPGSFQAGEFYSLMCELLSQPQRSEVVWSALSVMQVAVRNPSACATLSLTYRCTPLLTGLLDSHLYSTKRSVILTIIQELSYGVVIRWQEAHLPRLIQMLVEIIKGDERELTPLALGVMVNLCHKNKPAVYTLTNTVNIKAFLRTVLNLQRENAEISVQVCKLVMVLDALSGSVPDADILTLVRVSFKTMKKAFSLGNTNLMRHIIDFFQSAAESEHGKKVILSYSRYAEETERLLNTLVSKEPPNSWQSVRHLVEFLSQLVCLTPAVAPLSAQLTQAVLPWLRVSGVAQSALTLLTATLRQTQATDDHLHRTVCSSIQNSLEVVVEMLQSECRAESLSVEEQQTMASLLHLLGELASNVGLSTAIVNQVDKEVLKSLFLPLMVPSDLHTSQLFQQPTIIALYVEALSLISKLSMDDKNWLFLCSDLLQKNQIQKVLALGLYFGSCEVKKKILFLAGSSSFSKECIANLSKCLGDLSDLTGSSQCSESNPLPLPQPGFMDVVQYPSYVEGESLNHVIEKLEGLIEKNQIENTSLTSIIELYHFKLNEMKRAEAALRSNLAAADWSYSQLRRQVAHLGVQTSRLHQLLYSGQVALEGSRAELVEVRQQQAAAEEAASSTHTKLKQLNQDSQSKSLIIKEQNEEIMKLKCKIEDQNLRLEELTQNLKAVKDVKEDQEKLIKNLELRNSDLISSNTQLEERVKSQEKEMAEQKQVLSNQSNQLLELERMRKIIFEITGGKKNI